MMIHTGDIFLRWTVGSHDGNAAVVIERKIYVLGGANTSVEMYDVEAS